MARRGAVWRGAMWRGAARGVVCVALYTRVVVCVGVIMSGYDCDCEYDAMMCDASMYVV